MRSWARVAAVIFGVAWGANQFSPLLLVYRDHGGLPQSTVTLAFAAYAAGLVPALLLAVPLTSRAGRVPVLRGVLVCSALASVVLLAGGAHPWTLITGRLLAGIASGAAFGPGTSWIKELSAGTGPGVAARRAAVPLSAGFGGGPLVAGALGQWAPAPQVTPYLVHLLLLAAVAVTARRLPASRPAPAAPGERVPWWVFFRHPGLRREVAPTAPLVFVAATTAFAVLPGLVAPHSLEVAAGGCMAGLTLGSGLAAQPLSRRLVARTAHGTRTAGLAAGTAGLALAAAAAGTRHAWLLLPAGLALGACYGVMLVSGLTRVEALAAPAELPSAVAVYYCLTYLGFAAPYAVAALHTTVAPATVLAAGAVLCALLIPFTAAGRHRRDTARTVGRPVGVVTTDPATEAAAARGSGEQARPEG